MTRVQPFERAFGTAQLGHALETLAQHPELPPLYTYYDLNALARSAAATAASTVD
jgi:hypothetical protein